MSDAADDGGRVVAGRYELRGELGRGGMGVVWHAWDTALDRPVAVKEILLPPGMAPEERAAAHARMRREARSAARISDEPGVITVYDVFDAEDHPWVVMQLVHGGSLFQEVRRQGRLPHGTVARVAADLLGALRAAHAAGVVHRDIKPGNVMVAGDGRALLTDFGIATIEGETAVTRTGALIGSPEFMAPERLHDGTAEPPSDLWSLGVTLYCAVEGVSPFKRDTVPGSIAAVLTAPLPPPRYAGPLTPLITGLLDRDPARRLTADAALGMLFPTPTPPRPYSGGAAVAPQARQEPATPATGGGPEQPSSVDALLRGTHAPQAPAPTPKGPPQPELPSDALIGGTRHGPSDPEAHRAPPGPPTGGITGLLHGWSRPQVRRDVSAGQIVGYLVGGAVIALVLVLLAQVFAMG